MVLKLLISECSKDHLPLEHYSGSLKYICHCEPCEARRGNLPKFQAQQLKQNSFYCIKEIATVCLRNKAMTSIEFRQPEQNTSHYEALQGKAVVIS